MAGHATGSGVRAPERETEAGVPEAGADPGRTPAIRGVAEAALEVERTMR